MAKTLVIAEKPSVGRDLTRALPGQFAKHEGYLESDSHVVTWAVGHLVQLAEPDEYDAKYKKWLMADLLIVPDDFQLVVRDERSRKQMTVITRLLQRKDVDLIVNACDAGREGELIFAWTLEKSGVRKPVRRLWLSSMTTGAIKQAFSALRPGSDFAKLEEAARSRAEAEEIVGAVRGGQGEITKLETTKRSEKAPLLYDLTSLQREANTRYGFSARRTLAAAQRLYEEHKALTYPRTNSRFLPSDMGAEIKPIAGHVGEHREYARAAAYVTGMDVLPTGRVINDAKVTDHHAIIPTNSSHRLDKMSDDDRRIYDMVARRFLAVFHPEAVFENTRLETTVAEHVFRTRGRVLLVAGWRGVYGEEALESGAQQSSDDDEGGPQQLPKLERGEAVDTKDVAAEEKVTKPPRRYSDASLLAAMETAGKLVDDDELREAMKDSGIGPPATRAAIIERLIDVGYIEREGRSLVATEKGTNVIKFLGGHAPTSPSMTGDWEHRLAKIEHGGDSREKFMSDIAKFA